MEDVATMASTDTRHAAAVTGDDDEDVNVVLVPTYSVTARAAAVTATPAVLARRSGRRPRRSVKSMPTRMKHVFTGAKNPLPIAAVEVIRRPRFIQVH
jgi:hypothetical protein